jgi:hypothetical protein
MWLFSNDFRIEKTGPDEASASDVEADAGEGELVHGAGGDRQQRVVFEQRCGLGSIL